MKYLLALTFFSSTLLHATAINLNVGDTITLQANSTTTVSCGGDNATCKLPVKNLKAKFDYCKSNINNSVEECLNQVWPNFKRSNSQCLSEGFDTCLTFCKSSFQTLDCLSICE
ncbi:MAG: hypothetical protein PHY93_02740 [Bacteriovorax sp.]|nr:hypothetical protein [Bacteriovorax sp.]